MCAPTKVLTLKTEFLPECLISFAFYLLVSFLFIHKTKTTLFVNIELSLSALCPPLPRLQLQMPLRSCQFTKSQRIQDTMLPFNEKKEWYKSVYLQH